MQRGVPPQSTTNGGVWPMVVTRSVSEGRKTFPRLRFGLLCHARHNGQKTCPTPLYKSAAAGDHNTMPYGDFNLHGLACYLDLTPQQVAKLADRGHLPGRKVSGEWRFSKADIHQWLEQRIGLSDEDELLDVEGVLRRSASVEHEQEISIAELLPLEAIAVPLPARTRSSVIDSMVELAGQTGWLWESAAMAEAIRSREEMHSTAAGQRRGLAPPAAAAAQDSGPGLRGLGHHVDGHSFWGRRADD